jgi:hypothetical protein
MSQSSDSNDQSIILFLRIIKDSRDFRAACENLVSLSSIDSCKFRAQMSTFWQLASRLYLDCTELARWCEVDTGRKMGSRPKGLSTAPVVSSVNIEQSIRGTLRLFFEGVPVWDDFNTENAIPMSRGLINAMDYINSLSLHLPEIYCESFRLERHLTELGRDMDESAKSRALVSVSHMGRNHISFVLPALEWLSDKDNWAR